MLYATIKNTDLTISKIILGTWAIGGSNWGHYDETESVRAMETAIAEGISTIDTAPAYGGGHAEELIGKVIKGKRERMVIATKCGLDIENGYRRDLTQPAVEKELEASLRRLGTDYIDLYQLHWPDPDTPMEYTMEALVKFKEQGKIRYIGISNFSAAELQEALTFGPITTLQPPYSLLDRSIEEEIQPLCVRRGLAIITYGSLGAGVLTGKYAEPPRFAKSDARSFFYPFFQKKYWTGVQALVDGIKQMAEAREARPGHIAIAWLLSREGVAGTIVGARNPGQVRDNLGGAGLVLAEHETGELDRLSAAVFGQGEQG